MDKETYARLLKSPEWQKKRLEVMQRDKFKCQICGDDKTTLNIHHEEYSKGHPANTPTYSLRTLCEDCHYLLSDHIKSGLSPDTFDVIKIY